MLEAMMNAQVGDDVFGDDPTVLALEKKVADMFGMQAALFCPSGTMTNQIAIKAHTKPADEVICDKLSHIYLYEGGGMMANSMVSPKLLDGDKGRITALQVNNAISPDDVHAPFTKMVSLENTMNKGGGSIYDFSEIEAIKKVCLEKGLILHLDGARLFNALVETNENPKQFGEVFDSISICLSKGLGCPVGSLLLGSQSFIKESKRIRKRMGGGWRQAGFLAAAGIFALDHHVNRLKEDHKRAKCLAEIVKKIPNVIEVLPTPTNIVIFRLATNKAQDFVKVLAQKEIGAVTFGPDLVRLVTHLEFDDDKLTQFEALILNL
jgi:threonine aldolase